MGYYSLSAERQAELDYDLLACLEENPQPGIAEDTIARVLATWPGENDGDDWRWVLALTDGRYAFVQGGCDYTGWDCQSWATSAFADTPEDAARHALGDVALTGSGPQEAGLGHMLNIIGGTYADNFQAAYESLLAQLTAGKDATWREQQDAAFGLRREVIP